MEQFNKIEIQGLVGNVRTNVVGNNLVCNFSIATSRAFKNKDSVAIIETTWFQASAWEGKGMPDLSKIEKGMALHLKGSISTRSYTAADGSERQVQEVKADWLEIIPDNIPAQI